MPDDTEGPAIVVSADRRHETYNAIMQDTGGADYGSWWQADAFQFASFAGGGGADPTPPPSEPEADEPEIIVQPLPPDVNFPLSQQELDAITAHVLDFLLQDYVGYVRFEAVGDQYQLDLFDYQNGEQVTYIYSTDSAVVLTQPLDAGNFDYPDGVYYVGPTGPFDFETNYY